MGHKVSPVGMRIGVNRDWNSRWYADDKNYHVFLNEDIRIRQYFEKELKNAGLSHVEIERSKTEKGNEIQVRLFVSKVGVVIGQEGTNVARLTSEVSKLVANSEVKVAVEEVKQPDLDAKLVAMSITKQIEERVSFRTAQKRAIQRVRKAGAKGCRTLLSGRLAGAEIARSEGYKDGIIPLHTLRSDIDFAIAEADTQYGKIGVKVWICRGEIRAKKKTNAKEGE